MATSDHRRHTKRAVIAEPARRLLKAALSDLLGWFLGAVVVGVVVYALIFGVPDIG